MPDYFRYFHAVAAMRHTPQTGVGASSALAHQIGFYFTSKEVWILLAIVAVLAAVAVVKSLGRSVTS